ncbi:hypothetical protein KI387_035709, partial [Taxus chinensis]
SGRNFIEGPADTLFVDNNENLASLIAVNLSATSGEGATLVDTSDTTNVYANS